jgi:hypothetical protein
MWVLRAPQVQVLRAQPEPVFARLLSALRP